MDDREPFLGRLLIGVLAAALLSVLMTGATARAEAPAWTTYRHDAQRSGIDPDSASPLPPKQLWQATGLDGPIYAEPLVYGSRVYVATENDTVYALDAATGAVLWHSHVGNPVPDKTTAGCGDIGNVGITSTPVIDPATGRIYVVAATWDGSNASSVAHRMFGFDLASGSEAPGLPITVDPPGSTPALQLQRVALGLQNGRLLIGYGGNYGDCGVYHGWLVSAPENGSGSLLTYEVNPTTHGGAIWGSGAGPAIDPAGHIWISTGNGFGSTFGFQESVLELDSSLHLVDHWTPSNWQTLDGNDADLGSSEPLLLGNGLAFEIGKEGVGYLLSTNSLGGNGGTPLFSASVCPLGSFAGGIYHGGVIYVQCKGGMKALALNVSGHSFTALPGWSSDPESVGPPIFAGGLVWSAGWYTGVLFGLDPATGETKFSANLGGFEHFAIPSAGGGRLFVANGSMVTAFTIAKFSGSTSSAPSISRLRIRAHHHLTLTLTLSEPARLTVTIVRHTKKVRIATPTLRGKRGPNNFTLSKRGLAHGRYTATVIARDSNGAMTRRTIRFKVV